jgi:hypothetical protein
MNEEEIKKWFQQNVLTKEPGRKFGAMQMTPKPSTKLQDNPQAKSFYDTIGRFIVDTLRATPRTAGQVALTLSGGKSFQPGTGVAPKVEKFLFGDQPIDTLQDRVAYNKKYLENLGASKASLPLALALTTAGAGFDLVPAGGPGKKALQKVGMEGVEKLAQKATPEVLSSMSKKLTNFIDAKKLIMYEPAINKETAIEDLKQISNIQKKIREGKQVKPIEVRIGQEGELGVEDGKHRLQAFINEEVNQVPIKIQQPSNEENKVLLKYLDQRGSISDPNIIKKAENIAIKYGLINHTNATQGFDNIIENYINQSGILRQWTKDTTGKFSGSVSVGDYQARLDRLKERINL